MMMPPKRNENKKFIGFAIIVVALVFGIAAALIIMSDNENDEEVQNAQNAAALAEKGKVQLQEQLMMERNQRQRDWRKPNKHAANVKKKLTVRDVNLAVNQALNNQLSRNKKKKNTNRKPKLQNVNDSKKPVEKPEELGQASPDDLRAVLEQFGLTELAEHKVKELKDTRTKAKEIAEVLAKKQKEAEEQKAKGQKVEPDGEKQKKVEVIKIPEVVITYAEGKVIIEDAFKVKWNAEDKDKTASAKALTDEQQKEKKDKRDEEQKQALAAWKAACNPTRDVWKATGSCITSLFCCAGSAVVGSHGLAEAKGLTFGFTLDFFESLKSLFTNGQVSTNDVTDNVGMWQLWVALLLLVLGLIAMGYCCKFCGFCCCATA